MIDVINQIVIKSGIRTNFTCESNEQAKIASGMRIASLIRARADLRGKTVFTFNSVPIVGLTSGSGTFTKTDCAFSLDSKRGVCCLGLHIADTAEYVSESSPADTEAKLRGVSINLPGRSIPMLPDGLSRSACFFKEGEDRLAVSIFMDIDREGVLLSLRFEESVVRTARNCIFSEIDTLYTSTDSSSVLPLRERYAALLPNMNDMYELGAILYSARMEKGNVDFSELRRRYSFDVDGNPTSVELKRDFDSRLLVREFLIFAGVALADYMQSKAISCIYANQPAIKSEKMMKIAQTVGIDAVAQGSSDQLQASVFGAVRMTAKADLLYAMATMELPPMVYSTQPQLHSLFGSAIVRFSSPTSRYADLAVQRLIKDLIKADGDTARLNMTRIRKGLAEAALITSRAEAVSMKLQREVADSCSMFIMRASPYKVQPAYITGVAENRAEVFLENGMTGIMLFDSLFNKTSYTTFTYKGNKFTIGQRIEVLPAVLPEEDFSADENAVFVVFR